MTNKERLRERYLRNKKILEEASGGKWWLKQYFTIATYEIRRANPKTTLNKGVNEDIIHEER